MKTIKKNIEKLLTQEKIKLLEDLFYENAKNCIKEKRENPELWNDWLWSANFKELAEQKLEELKNI